VVLFNGVLFVCKKLKYNKLMFGLPQLCPFNTAVVATFFIGLSYNLHLKRAAIFSKIFLKFAPLNTALTSAKL